MDVTLADGSRVKQEKWGRLTIKLRAQMYHKLVGIILSDAKQVILGIPYLLDHKAKLHLEEGWIQLDGEWFQLCRTNKPLKVFQSSVSCDQHQDAKERLASQLQSIDQINVREQLRSILLRFVDVWKDDAIGRTTVIRHAIHVTTNRPIACRCRKYSEEQKKIIETEVKSMIEKNVIRPSESPYASGVVLVKKKTGEWRFCIDYRPLNQVTLKDEFPLPRIDDLLRTIRGSKWFIALDMRAGYWQVAMETKDIPKTAFKTPNGLFEFTVMPFGLINAPATFQRMVERLFGDLCWDGVLVYLDDIFIHAPELNRALQLLEIVLTRLQQAGLRLRLSKCCFLPKQIEYLGHVIQEGILAPQPKKIEALKILGSPVDKTTLRQALGMFGYYRNFIANYAQLTIPLTRLMKRDREFSWGTEEEKAFTQLKDRLGSAILSNEWQEGPLTVETDASDYAVAGVLSFNREGIVVPIEFMSKTLTEVEQRWPTREKEAYAIVVSLRKFDTFLRGRRAVVFTDHKSLQWMFNAKKGKIARWAATLQEYDLKIKHKSGREILHVDALSRLHHDESLIEDRMVFSVELDRTDSPLPTLQMIKSVQGTLSESERIRYGLTIKRGLLFRQNQIYVPTEQATDIIKYFHENGIGSHCGVIRTYKRCRQLFWWPNQLPSVREYLSSCLVCQRRRSGKERFQGLSRHLPLGKVFESVHIDFWEPTIGDLKIMTMIDRTSRWVEATYVKDKTAETVVSTFIRMWVSRYGVPRQIISDNDKAFQGLMMQELAKLIGSDLVAITPYHPEGNSPVESFHRHLRKHHQRILQNEMLDPEEGLALTLFLYRTSYHTSLEDTPGHWLFGVPVATPREREIYDLIYDSNAERTEWFNSGRDNDITCMEDQAIRHAASQNKKRSHKQIEEGDLVITKDFRQISPKIWSLPQRVVSVSDLGYSARVKDFKSGKVQTRHLTHLRKINSPSTPEQLDFWLQEFENANLPLSREDLLEQVGLPLSKTRTSPTRNDSDHCSDDTGSNGTIVLIGDTSTSEGSPASPRVTSTLKGLESYRHPSEIRRLRKAFRDEPVEWIDG
ncbi:putative retrotransposon protein [Gregarina niphandrodes]|uniref:Retrotransposon protein n=1 Tax=Gregarina niphandrodes TaxID=110365 RepID=A0A023AWJ7_GRENI|nr:putative retrotransposon protein [Gregarina niphandrodes]EZG42932.1 putative retrotransposon protein [Gregarina niphandrodes]|eukprot:XP_011133793.1 putative retrotransposon protein [Gregarina niphandrodes]